MTANIVQAGYEDLDYIAARFAQQAEITAALDSQVRQCVEALAHGGWEGKGASAFFNEMHGEILPATQRLITVLSDARAVTLEVKQVLLQAEQDAAALFGRNGGSPGDGTSWLDRALTGAGYGIQALGYARSAQQFLAALGLKYTMKDGKLIISGGRALKELAGLDPNLTRIDPGKLPMHMARQGLKIGKGAAVLAVLPSWIEDWQKYRGEGPSKVAAAMAVDAGIKIPEAMLTGAAGGLAIAGGAALLGVSAPAVVVVAGGAVVSVAASEVLDRYVGPWIESRTHIRERAIDALDNTIDTVGRGLSDVTHHVDRAFDSAVDAVRQIPIF